MKRSVIAVMSVVAICWATSEMASANVITLQFNANDVFDYATSTAPKLDQQGTVRRIERLDNGSWAGGMGVGDIFTTDSDGRNTGTGTYHDDRDLTTVANILGWTGASAGYQGFSHVQLWLQPGYGSNWGEKILQKPTTSLTISVNETGWLTTDVDGSHVVHGGDGYDTVHFNTALGGVGFQNAISPSFNPADSNWSVTGDFYVDVNENDAYDPGTDTDLVLGQQYTIWFAANFNNWQFDDTYGTSGVGFGEPGVTGLYDDWGAPGVTGTLIATAVPEPGTLVLLVTAGLGALGYVWRRRRS